MKLLLNIIGDVAGARSQVRSPQRNLKTPWKQFSYLDSLPAGNFLPTPEIAFGYMFLPTLESFSVLLSKQEELPTLIRAVRTIDDVSNKLNWDEF